MGYKIPTTLLEFAPEKLGQQLWPNVLSEVSPANIHLFNEGAEGKL
jgi:hypothetical protein